MTMKAVVFGGSGFLGSHVADALTDSGIEVTIFDRAPSPYLRENQKMFVGDILDRDQVRESIQGVDYVYHFAGIADIDKARLDPVDTVRYNVLGTVVLLDACREYGVKRFLFASTIYVYSDHGSFYRSSKQAGELFIENYQKVYGVNYTILRYGSLFGRRANEFNWISKVIRQALLDGRIEREGDGNEIREYVNVLDAARASVEILGKGFENSYVTVTGPQALRVRDILEMINEMLDKTLVVEYLPERNEDHYETTPYSFRPRMAKKYISSHYYDLGQSLLDCIYDAYEQISKERGSDRFIFPPSIKTDEKVNG